MWSAVLTFLGGGAFRMIWGEVSSYLNKRQDNKLELARLELQGKLDAAQHSRNMEAITLQANLGVKTIEVQSAADVARVDAEAFREAMSRALQPTGIWWVDAWNGTIRPSYATLVLGLWFMALVEQSWILNDWDRSLMGAIVGWFFADRSLRMRGK